MSFWKRLLYWLDAGPEPKPEVEVEETPVVTVRKEERIAAELDDIIAWAKPVVEATLAAGGDVATNRWQENRDGLFIEDVQIGMYRQVEGYYVIALKLSVAYSRRFSEFVFHRQSYEETWLPFDNEFAESYLYRHLTLPVERKRNVNTPLFGEFSRDIGDGNTPTFMFYIGELPVAKTIDGQYTPENHEQLAQAQRDQRTTYRMFVDKHLVEQAHWDARAFVFSLHERLADSNATHLQPNDSFTGVFHDSLGSGNLGGYELKADGELIFSCYNRYGTDRRLEEILTWCWTLQNYHRHYQDLFLAALAETLAGHNSTTRRWRIERDGLLWLEHPDARFCKMRFRLQAVG